MKKDSALTVIGVVAAVIIAWFLVDGLFKLVWFAAKLGVVAVVALLVYIGLRSLVGQNRR